MSHSQAADDAPSPDADSRTTLLKHASPAVAAAIRELMAAAYTVEAEILGVDEFPPLRRSAEEIASAGSSFLGIWADGELAAVAETEAVRPGLSQLSALVVHPARFRTGLGTILLRDVVRRHPAEDLTVTTGIRNTPALGLYAANGFQETGRWSTPDGIPMVTLVRTRAR